MPRADIHTEFCRDATCPGFGGVDVPWDPGDETCPPFPEIDACPHCGYDLVGQQLPYEDAIGALLDALDESDTGIDALELLVAIQAGLERQRRALAERLKAASSTPADAFPDSVPLPF